MYFEPVCFHKRTNLTEKESSMMNELTLETYFICRAALLICVRDSFVSVANS